MGLARAEATGCIDARPSGGSVSPLEDHGSFLLGLIAKQPDLTLDEIVAAMAKAGIAGSRTSVWRFYERRGITFKKKRCTRRSNSAPTSPAPADDGSESSARSTPDDWSL
jgi:transposase